jgi:hypothetical protein
MDINQIISFILNPTFSGWLLFLKILFIFFSSLLLGFIIFALIKTTWLKRLIIWDLEEFLTYRHFGVSKVARKWERIKKRLEGGIESEAKLAIIEADSMLDGILERMGFGGKTLGERLDKLTTASLPNIEELREAHKIRNNIVHDPTYKLDLEEAKKVILAYEKALTDLQAL